MASLLPARRRSAALVPALAALVLALYLALDPLHLSPVATVPDFAALPLDSPPNWRQLSRIADAEDKLRTAEVRFRGQVMGPESLAFDARGRGPYTGLSDGRVVRWDGPAAGWSLFATTSPNR